MANVYQRSSVKTVFVWICIFLMIYGWYLSIKQTQNRNIVNTANETITNKIFNLKDKIDISPFGFKEIKRKYGGYLMFLTGWFLFVIFEITWNPYKDLKNVSNKDLQETLNK